MYWQFRWISSVFEIFFSFCFSVVNVTQSQSCSAVLLLSMISGADPEIANANIRILISHELKQHGDNPCN